MNEKLDVFRPVRISTSLDALILTAAKIQNSTCSDVIRQCCKLVLAEEGSNEGSHLVSTVSTPLVLDGCKQCEVCDVIRPLTRFHKNDKHNGNQPYHTACKQCELLERQEKRREAVEETLDEKQRKRREYGRKWRAGKFEWQKRKAVEEKKRERERREEEERQRRYIEAHPEMKEKSRDNSRAYRAWKAGAEGLFTEIQFQALCSFYGNLCLRCGQPKELHADHVVSLSKGGSNYIQNIQPLCKSCNSGKRGNSIDYRKELPDWEELGKAT